MALTPYNPHLEILKNQFCSDSRQSIESRTDFWEFLSSSHCHWYAWMAPTPNNLHLEILESQFCREFFICIHCFSAGRFECTMSRIRVKGTHTVQSPHIRSEWGYPWHVFPPVDSSAQCHGYPHSERIWVLQWVLNWCDNWVSRRVEYAMRWMRVESGEDA